MGIAWMVIAIKLAKYAIRVGDQKRHWKKIWREVWSVQRRLTVDCCPGFREPSASQGRVFTLFMVRGCVLEIYRATFCGHLVDCWNTETGVTGIVHGCFTFFWAGDARVSAQDLNCDFYLYNDAIHPLIWTHFTVGSSGGPQTFHTVSACWFKYLTGKG